MTSNDDATVPTAPENTHASALPPPAPVPIDVPKPAGQGRTITALATLPERTLLDECALSAALNLSKRTVRRMVSRHELPPPFRFAGKSTWLTGKVLAHIEARAERQVRDAERAARKLEAS